MLRAGAGLLGGAALTGLVGGCTSDGRTGASSSAGQGTADADEALLERARADQERVLAVCTAVLHHNPRLAPTMRPLVLRHRVQVETLGGQVTSARTGAPRSAAGALRLVLGTEAAASRSRARDARHAASGDFARVLGAMAAGQAQNVQIVRSALAEEPGS